jgi:hypothetical protein
MEGEEELIYPAMIDFPKLKEMIIEAKENINMPYD